PGECGDVGGMADADGADPGAEREQCRGEQRQQPQDGRAVGRVGNADSERFAGCGVQLRQPEHGREALHLKPPASRRSETGGTGNAEGGGCGIVGDAARAGRGGHADGAIELGGMDDAEHRGCQVGNEKRPGTGATVPSSSVNGAWADAAWIPCRDGKLRAIQRATQPEPEPMVDGLPDSLGRCRVGVMEVYAPLIEKGKCRTMRLRGYGNAIVPPLAAEFIRAYIEVLA